MKVVEIVTCVTVEDDFEWESDLGQKLLDHQDLEDICEYDSETGCSIEHWGHGRVYTQEEYEAQFEDE